MKGTIQTRRINPIKNKLVIEYHWFEKDYTDSEYCQRDYVILESEYERIINEGLVGKEVEFEEIKQLVKGDDHHYATILWPKKKYSEEEVHALVLKTWHEGYRACDESDGTNPDIWWDKNKKK